MYEYPILVLLSRIYAAVATCLKGFAIIGACSGEAEKTSTQTGLGAILW